jgi:hypothetical protein
MHHKNDNLMQWFISYGNPSWEWGEKTFLNFRGKTLNRTATPTNRLVGVHLNRGFIGGQSLTMPSKLHVKFHFLILYFTFLSCNVWSVQP